MEEQNKAIKRKITRVLFKSETESKKIQTLFEFLTFTFENHVMIF
jgi:hypothetical protein